MLLPPLPPFRPATKQPLTSRPSRFPRHSPSSHRQSLHSPGCACLCRHIDRVSEDALWPRLLWPRLKRAASYAAEKLFWSRAVVALRHRLLQYRVWLPLQLARVQPVCSSCAARVKPVGGARVQRVCGARVCLLPPLWASRHHMLGRSMLKKYHMVHHIASKSPSTNP